MSSSFVEDGDVLASLNPSNKLPYTTYALGWYFAMEGLIMGCWAALIPSVKDIHHLSNAMLGYLLLCAVFGGLLCIPLAAWISGKIGSCNSLIIGVIVLICLIPVIGLPGSKVILAFGLIGLGLGISWVDISINAQAVLLEKHHDMHSMGLLHAIYAVGGLTGALFGGALQTSNLTVFYDFSILSGICVLPSAVCYFGLIPKILEDEINDKFDVDSNERKTKENTLRDELLPSPVREERVVSNASSNISEIKTSLTSYSSQISSNYLMICLCLLGGIGYFSEGAMGDWSAIFMDEELEASPFVSSLGFAFFQLSIAIGRYASDYMLDHYNRYNILKVCGIVASVGLSVVIISPSLLFLTDTVAIIISLIGFSICGAGISMVAPIVISTSGSAITHMKPTDAIATVTSFAYIGVMIGPPLIGSISEVLGELRYAFIIIVVLFGNVSIVAFMLQKYA